MKRTLIILTALLMLSIMTVSADELWYYKQIPLRQVPNEQVKQELINLIDEAHMIFYSYRAELDTLTNTQPLDYEALNRFREEVRKPADARIYELTIYNPLFKQYSVDNQIFYHFEEYLIIADTLIDQGITPEQVRQNSNVDENIAVIMERRWPNSRAIPLEEFESNTLVIQLNERNQLHFQMTERSNQIITENPNNYFNLIENDPVIVQIRQQINNINNSPEIQDFDTRYNNFRVSNDEVWRLWEVPSIIEQLIQDRK